jgi:hypothetical protein
MDYKYPVDLAKKTSKKLKKYMKKLKIKDL